MIRNIKRCAGTALVAALAMLQSGCSLWHDDLPACAVPPDTHTTVDFLYDYNTDDKDYFADMAGGVTLYIFEGTKLASIRELSAAEVKNGAEDGLRMRFSSEEMLPGHTYSLYAVAHGHQNGYQGMLTLPGAHFLRTEMLPGVHGISDYTIRLEHSAEGTVTPGGRELDKLWISMGGTPIEIPETVIPKEGDPQPEDRYVYVTLPMMLITNEITVTFYHPELISAIDDTQYEVTIETDEGSAELNLAGAVTDHCYLKYRPYSVRKKMRTINSRTTACVEACFSVSRLMAAHNMRVVVRDLVTGQVCTVEHLPAMLAEGKKAYSGRHWSDQEYLDREHSYDMTFELGYPMPKWIDLQVKQLSWTHRVQGEDL